MTRLLRLWAEAFTLSWRRVPALTLAALASLVVRVAAIPAGALALRDTVDASTKSLTTAAVIAAAAAAVAYALVVVSQDVTDLLILTIGDRVGRLDIHPRIHRDLATLEGLDHLERDEYLDRVVLVQKAGGHVAASIWNALASTASLLNLAVSLLLLGSISPWLLSLLVFAAVPIWSDNRGQRAIQSADLKTAQTYRLQQHLFELCVTPAGGKELRVADAGPELVRRQSEAWWLAMADRNKACVRAGGLSLAGWTVFVAAFTGALALAAYQAGHGRGTPGDLVLLVTLAVTLRASIQAAVERTAAAANARRFVAPYLWLRQYAAQARLSETGSGDPPAKLRDGFELDHVSYRYPGATGPALDDISVRLKAGSVVAIVGEYGSGKSTLVKLLCKFYQPAAGKIVIDGTDLALLHTGRWRARCTAAFQDFGRFHTRFMENVGLGDVADLENEDRIRAALADADASELAQRLPGGLRTLLGSRLGGIDLSEGQWQRTALARASMRTDPLLMILDEPTASLDAPSERAIFERYMSRARDIARRTGAVTVIVSHRFATVTNADHILVLDHGRLIESGSHRELVRRGGTYAELYAIQASAYRAG